MNSTQEIWKPIENLKEYSVSNHGRFMNNFSSEILPLYKDSVKAGGNLTVAFPVNNGVKAFMCSRIISKTFLPNPKNKSFIKYIDNNPNNIHISNLRWITDKEFWEKYQ